MATVEEVQRLRATIETLGREVGEIDGRKKRLVDELARLGYKSLEQALAAQPAMKKKLQALQKGRDDAIREFYAKYGKYLEGKS